MRRLLLGLAVAAMYLASQTSAQAGSILYFRDFAVGTDRMQQALDDVSGAGTHVVTVVTSAADFETQLATGTYDLGIFFAQNFSATTYTSAINALGTFVAGGGHAIYADWSRQSGLASQFGATFTGGINESLLYVDDPQMSAGVTNPITLTNPGWGVFSTGISGSHVAGHFGDGEGAIIVGNDGRSIVNGFLSDTPNLDGVTLYKNQISYLLEDPSAVPEPASLSLLGLGAFGLAGYRLRKRKQVAAA